MQLLGGFRVWGGVAGVGDAGAASPTNQSVYHIQEHERPDCFISLRQHIYMEQFEISSSASVSGWDCANATLLTMRTFFLGFLHPFSMVCVMHTNLRTSSSESGCLQ